MQGRSAYFLAIALTLVNIGWEIPDCQAANTYNGFSCGFLEESHIISQDQYAVPAEHQWLAIVKYKRGAIAIPTGNCMAVLVTRRNLLAPAHCFLQFEGNPEAFSVQLGVWNKSTRADEVSCLFGYCVVPPQEIQLAQIAIYRDYDPLTLQHSLAVLTLKDEAKVTPNVMPVCLPPPQTGLANDTLVGQMYFMSGFPTNRPLKNKAWVKTVSRSWCERTHTTLIKGTNIFCGYLQKIHTFYLGSPVVAIQLEGDVPKHFYLIGIQLQAQRVDNTGRMVASFLDVRPYMSWIENNIIADNLIDNK